MNIIVVGYGSIGRRHVDVLESLFPSATITVVTKQTLDRPHVASLSQLDLSTMDYGVIAVPTVDHHAVLTQLRHASSAPILVEKPLFDQFQDVELDTHQIYVGYNLRFHPAIQALRTWVSGQEIYSVHCKVGQYLPTWRPGTSYQNCYSAKRAEGGGVLLDLSHEIDYLNWIFGPMIPQSSLIGHVSHLDIDSDDLAMIQGIFERGGSFQVSMDYLSLIPTREIWVNGAHGTLVANFGTGTVSIAEHDQALRTETIAIERNVTYRAMHEAVFSGGALCLFDEGMDVLAIIKHSWEVNQR